MKRPRWMIVSCLLALLVANGAAYLAMDQSRQRAQRAAAQTAECQDMASFLAVHHSAHLAGGDHRRNTASGGEPASDTGDATVAEPAIASRVESACLASGIPAQHIVWVRPGGTRRINQSALSESYTQVRIRDASVAQAMTFMDALLVKSETEPSVDRTSGGRLDSSANWTARSIRLAAPRDPGDESNWLLELTLAVTLHDPR